MFSQFIHVSSDKNIVTPFGGGVVKKGVMKEGFHRWILGMI